MQNVLWMMLELAANLIESFFCIDFIVKAFDGKFRFLKAKSVYLIGILSFAASITILNRITEYEGFLGITYVCVLFIFSLIFLRGKVLKKLFISLLILLCLISAAAVSGNILSAAFGSDQSLLYKEGTVERFIYMVVGISLIVYVLAIVLRFIKGRKESLSAKEWTLILSVLGISFLIFNVVHLIILSGENSRNVRNLLMLVELGIIFINILCLYMTSRLNNARRREEQFILEQKHSEYSRQYAQTVKEQYEQTRRLRHDMKQYSATMLALIRSGKTEAAEKLAEEQTDDFSKIETVINVDNDFLNAILNSKLSFARSKDIDVLCSIENDLSGIENTDLCNLMGNLLDNAVSAAEKCEPDSRLIEVNISSANSKLIIIIKNSICNFVLEENPKLKSTKQDASHHGYGIKTIRSIAEKYNGTVDFFEEGLMFICRVELQREETIEK